MDKLKERRKGYKSMLSGNFMEIMTICALVVVIFIPEIVGLLESVK